MCLDVDGDARCAVVRMYIYMFWGPGGVTWGQHGGSMGTAWGQYGNSMGQSDNWQGIAMVWNSTGLDAGCSVWHDVCDDIVWMGQYAWVQWACKPGWYSLTMVRLCFDMNAGCCM